MGNKILDFLLDMKNLLSLGALFVFVYGAVIGMFTPELVWTAVIMVFTFFLGSKVNKPTK